MFLLYRACLDLRNTLVLQEPQLWGRVDSVMNLALNQMWRFYFCRGAPVMEVLWFSYELSIKRQDWMEHFFMAPGGR